MRRDVRGESKPYVRTRNANEGDEAFIRLLGSKLFLAYGSYDQYLVEWFRSDSVATFIGEFDNVPSGFFMLSKPCSPALWSSELLALAVAEEWQSQGIGRLLLDAAIVNAKALSSPIGIQELQLSVAWSNYRAQRLFAKRGFRVREHEGIYPLGQRARRMCLVLES